MDTLEVLRRKVASLASTSSEAGASAIVRHVEIAERHYDRGSKEDEQDYYLDVIYRTNQAYEGALKEAYTVLVGRDAAHMPMDKIEKYFQEKNVFHERVVALFRNYRQQWRNPAAHDYKLLMTEYEAFAAILGVTSFVAVLLDQILEKVGFEREIERLLTSGKDELKARMPVGRSAANIAEGLLGYAKELDTASLIGTETTEQEILGRVQAYFSQAGEKVTVQPVLADGLRPDLMVEAEEGVIPIEIRLTRRRSGRRPHPQAFQQMLTYIRASSVSAGILVELSPTHVAGRLRIDELDAARAKGKPLVVYWIHPAQAGADVEVPSNADLG